MVDLRENQAQECTVYEIEGNRPFVLVVVGEKDTTWDIKMLDKIDKEYGPILKAYAAELRFTGA